MGPGQRVHAVDLNEAEVVEHSIEVAARART